jgi:hypothetical protein
LGEKGADARPPAALDIPYATPTLGDAIEKTFANVQVTPNDDPALAFRLGVPGDWASAKGADPAVEKALAPQGLGSFASSVFQRVDLLARRLRQEQCIEDYRRAPWWQRAVGLAPQQ